eukprot:CAMPEP_0183387330 /NCGR_PEP_ID=MMETSP0370-20130417/3116_1 /TAXON_ID=268820 /ORGANISM="Peridinium aciculiferum, Strain PAER-2" /LENGTH=155 /DNA_ID=CAMNT_0025565895 /DNA_START=77 /DNA_END=544 /DNA_ORIENTATION=-
MTWLLGALVLVLLGCTALAEDGFNAIQGVQTTYKTLTEGTGDAVVEKGDTVTVHATGIVRQTDKKFWSTKDSGQQPFTYTAGGGVITGWDKGAMGMKIGEVRLLMIPAAEGYGANGFPAWGIPKNGDLSFEIEVLTIKGKSATKAKRMADSEQDL